ncbi:MAG: alpha/beta hydrolase [Marmoricola sp.]
MKRLSPLAGLLCALLLLAGLAGITSTAAGPAAAAPASIATLAAWTGCSGGFCHSTLTVPLDYAHPDDGRTVRLAVTRLAADPSAGSYLGIVVGNPGGPGVSGTDEPFRAYSVPVTSARRYDWIGFDPRGVGASQPSLHCNPRYFGANRPSYVPRTRTLMRFWLRKIKGYAAACGRSSAHGLLPFMTTRDTAQDMESLRAALQAQLPSVSPRRAALEKLNYLGFSYGTYLGEVYATLYPARVGRFVLAGVVDPTRYWYGANIDQDVWFDNALTSFFRWVAAHPRRYHLGTSVAALRHGFYAELRALDRHPSAGGRLGPDELRDAMVDLTYTVNAWPATASAYSALVRYHRGGALYATYADDNRGAAADNLYAVYNAVQCTDQRAPAWSVQVRDTWRVHAKHPYMAWDNTWYNAPCIAWPAPARPRVSVSGAALVAQGAKILLISETRDAATPYSGALRTRGLFPTASLIAGVGGTTHAAALDGVACVDDRIAAFLATGAVPARQAGRRSDLSCPAVRRP